MSLALRKIVAAGVCLLPLLACAGPVSGQVEIDRCLQPSEAELVASQRAKQRFAVQSFDEALFPRDNSCLRATKKFIAAEADQIGAFSDCICHRRFVFV